MSRHAVLEILDWKLCGMEGRCFSFLSHKPTLILSCRSCCILCCIWIYCISLYSNYVPDWTLSWSHGLPWYLQSGRELTHMFQPHFWITTTQASWLSSQEAVYFYTIQRTHKRRHFLKKINKKNPPFYWDKWVIKRLCGDFTQGTNLAKIISDFNWLLSIRQREIIYVVVSNCHVRTFSSADAGQPARSSDQSEQSLFAGIKQSKLRASSPLLEKSQGSHALPSGRCPSVFGAFARFVVS